MECTVIGWQSLDYTISRKLGEIATLNVLRARGSYDVTFEQFVDILDNGMRDELEKEIKEYYAFLGDVEISINDAEYYKELTKLIRGI